MVKEMAKGQTKGEQKGIFVDVMQSNKIHLQNFSTWFSACGFSHVESHHIQPLFQQNTNQRNTGRAGGGWVRGRRPE